MKKVCWLVVIGIVALAAGCSSPKPETDLLECDAATMTRFPYSENGVIVESIKLLRQWFNTRVSHVSRPTT